MSRKRSPFGSHNRRRHAEQREHEPKAVKQTPDQNKVVDSASPEIKQGIVSIRNRFLLLFGLFATLGGTLLASKYLRGHLLQVKKDRAQVGCFDPEINGKYEIPEQPRYIPVTIHRILPVGREFAHIYDDFIKKGMKGLNETYRNLNLIFYISEVQNIHDDSLYVRYGRKKDSRSYNQYFHFAGN